MFKKLRKRILLAVLALTATSAPIITPILTSPPAIAAEAKNGIMQENGDRVLYINGAKQVGTGTKKFNGKTYYIKDSKVAGEIVTNLAGWCEIHSAVPGKTNYVIDVNGAAFDNGTENGIGEGNIQIWQDNNSIAQRFYFKHRGNGIYSLTTGTGNHQKSIDVVNGKKNANIRQWDINNANAENFIVVKNFEGTLNFINVSSGQAIDISGDDKFDNGRNIGDYQYLFGKDKGQNFTVEKICNAGELPFNPSNIKSGWYYIQPQFNKKFYLDVNGNKTNDGTNIQLFGSTGSNAQKFYIKNLGRGFYSILTGATNAKSAVDAGGAKGNVHQWIYDKNNNNQKYKVFKYKIGSEYAYGFVNVNTGKALDVYGGSQYSNYTSIQNYQYILNKTGLRGVEGQEFTLKDATTPSYKHQTVTPEMFGAKGDGIADDTKAIQAAINAGKSVCMTKTYKVSNRIIIGSSITGMKIYGGGTIKATKTNFHTIEVFGKDAIIENITFKGSTGINKSTHANIFAIATSNDGSFKNLNLKVNNCKFYNTGKTGVHLHSYGCDKDYVTRRTGINRLSNISITNCKFDTNGSMSVCCAGADKVTISNNTFSNNWAEHVTLDWGTQNSTVTNNIFRGKSGGTGCIGLDSALNCTINNNRFEYPSWNAIGINGETGTASNITIKGNVFYRKSGNVDVRFTKLPKTKYKGGYNIYIQRGATVAKDETTSSYKWI